MIINIRCLECGEKVNQIGAEMVDGELNISVEHHECKPKESNVILSEAIELVDGDTVELGYFKKDGSFVTMTGYFPGNHQSGIGYEFFLKQVNQCFAPRNLLRRGITSVYHIAMDFTYIIR